MDEETYRQIPETLVLREIRFNVVEPGRRTRSIDIITTLTDADEYTKEDIAELYGFRWNCRTGYQEYQIESESRSRPMQIARDGSPRSMDDHLGLQSHSYHGSRCRATSR